MKEGSLVYEGRIPGVRRKDPWCMKAGCRRHVDFLKIKTAFCLLQMHSLLELMKKEQNIYNIIFHELIRQVKSQY